MSDISQAIIVSDTHCGDGLGLFPPVPFMLDNGQLVSASPLQLKVWSWWEEFWGEWVPMVTRGEPFAVVVNGDIIDGVHHRSVTQISQNIKDQRRIAEMVFRPVVAQCEGRFYMTRGTEAHGGKSGQDEEEVAGALGAIPDDIGNHARWNIRMRIGYCLVDITHHIGYTGSMQYETTALCKEFAEACAEAGRWHREAPDILIRSHRHIHDEIKVPTAHGDGICVVTPGWQLTTPFGWHGMSRNKMPQFGGILVRAGDEEHYTRHRVWSIEPTPEVTL